MNAYSGRHLVRFPAGFLTALHRTLRQGRSLAEAAFLLRQIGYEAGGDFLAAFEHWAEEEMDQAPLTTLPPEQFWNRLSTFCESLGWGTLQWEPLHNGVAALDAPNWLEAEGVEGEAHPGCQVTTGLLADLLTRMAADDVAVMEAECRAQGGARCRFLFGSPALLSQIYEEMQRGTSHLEAVRRLE